MGVAIGIRQAPGVTVPRAAQSETSASRPVHPRPHPAGRPWGSLSVPSLPLLLPFSPGAIYLSAFLSAQSQLPHASLNNRFVRYFHYFQFHLDCYLAIELTRFIRFDEWLRALWLFRSFQLIWKISKPLLEVSECRMEIHWITKNHRMIG